MIERTIHICLLLISSRIKKQAVVCIYTDIHHLCTCFAALLHKPSCKKPYQAISQPK